MATAAPGRQVQDLPRGCELIDGDVREMNNVGFRSGFVATQLLLLLNDWCRQHGMGVVTGPECSYQCFPGNVQQVRKPDVAVLLRDPAAFVPPDPHCREVPELVVEVLSPSNQQSDIADRIDDFLQAGTKLVWVIDPDRREAFVHHPDDSIRKIRESGSLSGEGVLPGFSIALASILPRK